MADEGPDGPNKLLELLKKFLRSQTTESLEAQLLKGAGKKFDESIQAVDEHGRRVKHQQRLGERIPEYYANIAEIFNAWQDVIRTYPEGDRTRVWKGQTQWPMAHKRTASLANATGLKYGPNRYATWIGKEGYPEEIKIGPADMEMIAHHMSRWPYIGELQGGGGVSHREPGGRSKPDPRLANSDIARNVKPYDTRYTDVFTSRENYDIIDTLIDRMSALQIDLRHPPETSPYGRVSEAADERHSQGQELSKLLGERIKLRKEMHEEGLRLADQLAPLAGIK